jgi:hypothetical protein
MATKYHYMHRSVHPRATPFGWAVQFDGQLYRPNEDPCGFIIFASIHFTKLRNEFGYSGLPTKWQVLSLSRLWLHDDLPQNSETVVIAKCFRQKGHEKLALVQRRWLEVHPPVYPDQPYHIRKIISYADTRYHNGTIYKAANFRETGRTVSRKRHRNSRGPGIGEAELIRFIYDLDEPRWKWNGDRQINLFPALET